MKNTLRDKKVDTVMRNYYAKRQAAGPLGYRLQRRTLEVKALIRNCYHFFPVRILDLRTADGLMLEKLSYDLNAFFVGVDLSFEILNANPERTFHPVQANGLNLPFLDKVFDVVIAAAVIEHVLDGTRLLRECYRVLKIGGLCILTTPDPFFDRISTFIGHQEKDFHYETFTLKKLIVMFKNCGFTVIKGKKFMMSPIGFAFELQIEKLMKFFGLSALLLNQLVVARKKAQSKCVSPK